MQSNRTRKQATGLNIMGFFIPEEILKLILLSSNFSLPDIQTLHKICKKITEILNDPDFYATFIENSLNYYPLFKKNPKHQSIKFFQERVFFQEDKKQMMNLLAKYAEHDKIDRRRKIFIGKIYETYDENFLGFLVLVLSPVVIILGALLMGKDAETAFLLGIAVPLFFAAILFLMNRYVGEREEVHKKQVEISQMWNAKISSSASSTYNSSDHTPSDVEAGLVRRNLNT